LCCLTKSPWSLLRASLTLAGPLLMGKLVEKTKTKKQKPKKKKKKKEKKKIF
jgi:hypothetical protein